MCFIQPVNIKAGCLLACDLSREHPLFNLLCNHSYPPSPTLLYGTQEVTKLTIIVFPCRLFFIKKQNNGYCLRGRA